jgi:hypothetical protein
MSMDKEDVLTHALSFYYGGMNKAELYYLYDLCIDKNVLELGSMVGMSSYVIASVAKEVSCVDIWSDNQDHLSHDPEQQQVYKNFLPNLPNMYESFTENCKEFINSGKLKMFQGNTQDMANNFNDHEFDVLLIDADHSYKGISSDFYLYRDKLKPDGLFIFHDYGDSMWKGIQEFCNEMVDKGELKMIGIADRIAACKNGT